LPLIEDVPGVLGANRLDKIAEEMLASGIGEVGNILPFQIGPIRAIIAQPLEKVKLASSTNHPYLLPA